ncbi:MAG TPA: hypothetical protein PLW93_05445 [Candidatus Absconditabacterales bacterium]|nr:hypothetical protein [Candidatus Absconditabacterales bacterium]
MSINALSIHSLCKTRLTTYCYYGNTLWNVQAMIQSYEEHIKRKYN